MAPPRRGKGRMASDRCGGGGRSSGKRLRRSERIKPHPSGAGWARNTDTALDGGRLSSRRAMRRSRSGTGDRCSSPPAGGFKAARSEQGSAPPRFRITTARSDRASSKRYSLISSGRCPALRVPFHQLTAIGVGSHRLAPTWRLRRLSAPVGGGAFVPRQPEGSSPLWGKTTAKRSVGGKYSPHERKDRSPYFSNRATRLEVSQRFPPIA